MRKIYIVLLIIVILFSFGCQKEESTNQAEVQSESLLVAENRMGSEEKKNSVIFDTVPAEPDVDMVETESRSMEQLFEFKRSDEKIDVEIREKMYKTQIDDIYVNTEDYLGETISIQGMCTAMNYGGDEIYHMVYREAFDGCCSNYYCGLEFIWDGEIPKDNEWIEVVGVLDEYTEYGDVYLTLRALSVEVLDKRGEEFVTQ
jgi:uncharacterized membrane protein YcgQ (UPF0703/DUF1980 family)